jgi:hypothetical protein
MTTLLLPLGIALLCFFQRCFFRLLFPRIHGFDAYAHQFITSCLREMKGRFYRPTNTNRYGLPVPDFAYPKLYHLLPSLVPDRLFPLFDRFLGPLLDAVFTLFIYALTLHLSGDVRAAVWMSLLFIFTPVFSSLISLAPRTSSFTPRGFSELVCNLYWLGYLAYLETQGVRWLGLTVLCGALIICSSKFSFQAITFITAVFCLLTLKLLPLALLLASFSLAMLVAHKVVWLSLKQQVAHLKWYYIQNIKGLMTVSDRNAIRPVWKALRKRDIRALVNLLLIHNSYFIAIVRFPWAIFALLLVLMEIWTAGGFPIRASHALILAAFIIFLLSSLKRFLFIGEAERYLNHVLLPILLASWEQVLPYAGWLCTYGAIYGLVDLAMASYLERKDHKLERSDNLMNLLKAQPGICNVLEVPFGLSGGFRILTETPHTWVYPVLWSEEDREAFNQYMSKYPVIDFNQLDEVVSNYKVHLVMIDMSKLNAPERETCANHAGLTKIGEVDQVNIYRTATQQDEAIVEP